MDHLLIGGRTVSEDTVCLAKKRIDKNKGLNGLPPGAEILLSG